MKTLRLVPLVAVLLASAGPVRAQGISDAAMIGAPTLAMYTFGNGSTEKKVTQYSSPLVLIIPFGSNFTVDLSTSYAKSSVSSGGVTSSSISGLTDTQLRGNYTLTERSLITLAINLPTGRYTVPAAEAEAAGQIGNAFLLYPVSGMGSGLSATGGIAFAQPLGSWNIGFGGSVRKATRFDAFKLTTGVLRFQPGDEYKARVGVDGAIGTGRLSTSLSYSKFGKDAADSTTFATGDRTLGQINYSVPISGTDFSVSVWDLYRAKGELIGATAPWENVVNLNIGLGMQVNDFYLQTSAEGRVWNVDGTRAGQLANLGFRLRFPVGAFSINPSTTVSVGKLYGAGSASSADLTGFRAQLLIRYN